MNQIPRREFIKLSGAIGASLAAGSLVNSAMAQTATPSRRPNIVVFLTDDHARWAQHAYPYAGIRFPDEFYDLQEDPRETVNRHDDPALKPVVSDLTAELDNFFAKYTVPGHDGLDLEHQPVFAGNSCWLKAQEEYGGTVNAYHARNSGPANPVIPSSANSKEN